jgi:pimeloyl-ACP methyl ester carboxylesterase
MICYSVYVKILKTRSFEIAANVIGPEDSSKIALLMPGRLDTKDYFNFVSHAEYLAQYGYFVCAIDPPGTWDSPGDLSSYSTSTYLKAIDEIIDHFGSRPILLLGHSRGGATAMLASSNPAVAGVAVINAAYGKPTPPDPKKLENGKLIEYRDIPPGNVRTQEQRRFDLPLAYFEDGESHNPLAALINYTGPKLIVHASSDEFTDLSKVKDIYASLSEPKMFKEITCTHDYRLYPEAIQAVNETLGHFIEKYLTK